MSSATTATATAKKPDLAAKAAIAYGDWRDEFFSKGYYIFKNAVPKDKAVNYYQKKALDWLGSFDNGFKLEDRSTWTKENLPQNFKSMYINYCAGHEKFMWDARTEPGVLKPFEQIWGTDELLVSFDTFNVSLPPKPNVAPAAPWPHTDQSPYRKGLACVQGILNLSQAGPKDGGLLLMVGSSTLFEKYFETFEPRERKTQGKHYDLYRFDPDEVEWYKAQGCREIKIEAEPGDLILWDSRTIHHVAPIETDTIRTVIYTCYAPAALASPEDTKYKAELFERFEGTTHWPHCNIHGQGKAFIDGKVDPLERDEPLEKPVRTDQILKLAGVKPY
ncbi:unnamed protein product [Clonostachys rhizophaga]|uniref:Uncharacterized protein n=1 Tax=Clonostachys rhizophaga TaxID=160324 RepID=A0A9N9YTW2_9HYPO|nr:unnamed protein product [Clonostachys rhizophaga]